MKLRWKKGGRGYIVADKYVHYPSIKGWGRVHVESPNRWKVEYGTLTAYAGYTWDGCSGPTKDSWGLLTLILACMVHDILYAACRAAIEKYGLKRREWEYLRKMADKEMLRLLKKHGMPWWRRAYYYAAVRLFGENAMLGRYRSKAREVMRKVCAPGICQVK